MGVIAPLEAVLSRLPVGLAGGTALGWLPEGLADGEVRPRSEVSAG